MKGENPLNVGLLQGSVEPSDLLTKGLSSREAQVLICAVEGLTDAEIAARLGISESTVCAYWGRIREKMGGGTRTRLVIGTLASGLLARVEALERENERLRGLLGSSPA